MGVDASYLYGYGSDVEEIDWDIEFLREKYKDVLNERIDNRYEWKPTWKVVLDSLEEVQLDEEREGLVDVLEDFTDLFELNYGEEIYLTFTHTHIMKLFPDSKLKDLDETAKLYAKELGIKNVDDIKWIEWGYFS